MTLALPFLESMLPAQTPLAQTAANPGAPRFLGLVSAHGWAATYWHDGRNQELAPTEGRNIGLGFVHTPLEPFQDQLTIVGGLDATSSMPPIGTTGGDHARLAAALTGAAAAEDRHLPGTQRRSIDRPEVRSGVAASVDPARDRRSGIQHRRLRMGIQLRVYQLDFLGGRNQAVAARSESSGCVRASVRRRRNAGRAPGPQTCQCQHSRSRDAPAFPR